MPNLSLPENPPMLTQLSFYLNHILPLARALADAQTIGVLIDDAERQRLLSEFVKQAEEELAVIRKTVGNDSFNPDSPKQLFDLLYSTMALTMVSNKKGKVSTDAECLTKLQEKYPENTLLQSLLNYRKASKLQDFLLSKTDSNGRMHTSFNASGTVTGRLSSSKNIFGQGMNLQNVPKKLRSIFIAPPGRSLVKQDLSQAEARVVAELMKRHGFPELSNLYFSDPSFDIHIWMGALLNGVPFKEVTKQMRDFGKVANHSGNYQAGPGVYVATALKYGIKGLSYPVASALRETRIEKMPGLRAWWDWVEQTIRKTRTISTCLGRRCIFFGRMDNSTFRDATAYEPQSLVGDVNNIIFRRLWAELPDDCFVILQVHDEVVVECPDEKIGLVLGLITKITSSIELNINEDRPLVIPGDMSVGKNWRDCKSIERRTIEKPS